MEELSTSIQQPLEFLIYASIIMLIIVTVFLVKLLADLSSLAKSLQSLTGIVKHEIEPTIKELKYTLKNISSIAANADSQVNNLNKTLDKGLDAISNSTGDILSKAKVVGSSIRQGILTGINVFLESRKSK